MPPKPRLPSVSFHSATVHSGLAPTHWRIELTGTSEPLLLPRILQKLAVPEIELCGVHYVRERPGFPSRTRVWIKCTRAWAELLTVRLRKLVRVQEVRLTQA